MIGKPTTAFIPENETIFVNLRSSSGTSVNIGTTVDLSIVVKNLFNNSIYNVTITEQIQDAIDFLETPAGPFDGNDINHTDISVLNLDNLESLSVNYLNITSNEFILNIPKIDKYETITLGFKINLTQVGSMSVLSPEISWYDHWGDRNVPSDDIIINSILFSVSDILVNPKVGYFPEIEVAEINYTTIIFVSLATIVFAIFGRILYMKKPFML
jgi:hypothetical protein